MKIFNNHLRKKNIDILINETIIHFFHGDTNLNFGIDDIIEIFSKNGLYKFNYIIHLNILKSIYEFGILCRNRVKKVGFYTKDISKDIYQEYRQSIFNKFFPNDDVYNYVPLYLSSHTPMIHAIRSPYKKYYAVLKIDLSLFYDLKKEDIKNIKIANTSINRKNIDSSFMIFNLIDCIDELNEFFKWELFNTNTQFLSSEKRQQKAAEILIPKRVSPQYILEVCPKCSEWILKQKYEFDDNIFIKINFDNSEFDFQEEKSPRLILNSNEENHDEIELNNFFFEDEEEKEDSNDWKKFF